MQLKKLVNVPRVYLDRNLNYQTGGKKIVQKMACSNTIIYYLRYSFPKQNRLLLIKSVVITHRQCSSVLLNGISQRLFSTSEKQMNWGIKACFNIYKMDSAQDLRIKRGKISIRRRSQS